MRSDPACKEECHCMCDFELYFGALGSLVGLSWEFPVVVNRIQNVDIDLSSDCMRYVLITLGEL